MTRLRKRLNKLVNNPVFIAVVLVLILTSMFTGHFDIVYMCFVFTMGVIVVTLLARELAKYLLYR